MTYPHFAFVDESGTLARDKDQPFFSIGLLLIEDTSRITEAISRIRNQAIDDLNAGAVGFEFKFNRITYRSEKHYRRLIDLVFAYPAKICIFVLDKTSENISYDEHFKSTWDAYIWYTKFLISKNVEKENPCILIMDYLCKPRNNPRFIESELRMQPHVLNATMLESESANLIQLIDVLVGSINYEFRVLKNPNIRKNLAKGRITKYLRDRLGIKTLATDFTVTRPVHFTVLPFSPNK